MLLADSVRDFMRRGEPITARLLSRYLGEDRVRIETLLMDMARDGELAFKLLTPKRKGIVPFPVYILAGNAKGKTWTIIS